MDLMGMKTCIVPPNPGNLSAFGLLAVDWRTDHIVTKVMHEDAIDLRGRRRIYASLEQRAATTLEKDGIAPAAHRTRARSRRPLRRAVDGGARAGAGRQDRRGVLAGLIDAFHAAHLQDLRLQLCRPAESRAGQFLRLRLRHDRAADAFPSSQSRHAAEARKPAGLFRRRLPRHAGFARASLAAGFALDGPAIVEEFGSTTVVFPGQISTSIAHGILIIRRPASRRRAR